ncbi:hypothetical protein [Alkaliphilus hydrothermalis]|uniref:Uncharacterized protein n=1 Tax=Alkaliphilus hydrothermalis TaxID=1482730 RepID=A0ABS2NQP0_9FIRM|nr:hypothetical protein [Alkaliphilus hydrothermalis]MBM7615244.1 hypothetical protein [Alkaliphilus hydrothermalis]
MTTLQAIIRLYEIKEAIEDSKLKWDYLEPLSKEFQLIKSSLLHSNFAFDKVKGLIGEVENKMNMQQ